MTNPTDPTAMNAWEQAVAASNDETAASIIQSYGDQREKAAVERVLSALTQPSPEMINAAVTKGEEIGYTDVVGVYLAMIAAFHQERRLA